MKLIVDIPDEMYDWIDNGFPTEDDYVMLWEEIRQGIPLEEKLKKIKAEMQEEHTKHTCFYVNGNHYCDHWGDLQIIDKHISELKGENKK